ncbi:alpha 1,4-glycosyltransferase family protein [Galdieria sulphuraria]|uniref:Alpha 1,4-glycosyltransferase family protein n=1 Tax=Galdieria sulphuraria TaxID=130081 RepID=M2XST9_GALSU|nr:alpha 1,4-glycosyltransferase family protein [Galdieria sulphuraria]EME26733.1 alpha 1,4-glycosyltransferase family protein [Galdieria sulphuraria]|eukprot:XP_005703253.1 alpha 1,4-glycosyltransferase family protein [Galdieria sulphuraria]
MPLSTDRYIVENDCGSKNFEKVPISHKNDSYDVDMHLKHFIVPDTVHFIFGLREDFDGKPYSLVQFLSVLSVKLRLNPTNMILHYAFEPSGIWWNATKELVTLRKVIVCGKYMKSAFTDSHSRSINQAPTHVCGRPLFSAAHRADYLRLEILHQFGGIYVDMDVLVLKPFHFLRQYDFSLGEEGVNASVGLGNAVLIARKGAPFVKRWRAEYCRHYDSSHWNHYSVMLPHRIYRTFPGEANVLPHHAFYMPLWDTVGLSELYFNTSQGDETENHLAIHLWSEKVVISLPCPMISLLVHKNYFRPKIFKVKCFSITFL